MNKIHLYLLLVLPIVFGCTYKASLEGYNEGVKQYDKANYHKAIDIFNKGIEKNDPFKHANYYGKARCYFELGKYKEAKKQIENCLLGENVLKPAFLSQVYQMKGLIEAALNEKELEIECYKKAFEYDKNNMEALVNYGFVLIESKQYEKAKEILNFTIKKDPNLSFAYNNRARANIGLGNINEAKNDLEMAIKLDKNNPYVYINKSILYDKLGDHTKSCEMLNKALSLDIAKYGSKQEANLYLEKYNATCN